MPNRAERRRAARPSTEPLRCPKCTFTTVSPMTLLQHTKKRHPEIWEQRCFYCKEMFADHDALRVHVHQAHINELQPRKELTNDTRSEEG